MPHLEAEAKYFRPPRNAFWQWAEAGHLIEWSNGDTLCYREELADLLRGQETTGLPRFGTILLVLAACQDTWSNNNRIEQLMERFVGGERGSHENPIESRLNAAKTFLDMVAALPADLRKGRRRIHLLRCFTGLLHSREVNAAQTSHLLDYFQSGQLDTEVFSSGPASENGNNALILDLWPFRQVCPRFNNVTELEHYLRTGLKEDPEPILLDIPDETPPTDLLDELSRHYNTAGLARLAQRLVAALHIPLHAQGSSELPLGGVSDITNRGDFDRLLLSELAQDDLTLTARLVNNEALFLRREEPPQHLERQRIVLMDTTLKMWGLPRVFALSTALACIFREKNATAVRAFTLGGEGFEPLDLHTKSGVTHALTRLDPALHCGDALRAFFVETPTHDTHDYMLVTGAEAMHDTDFQATFSDVRTRLRFLAVLHRDGRLEFFEYTNGHRKLLFSPQFDLLSLLFPQGEKRLPEADVAAGPLRTDKGLLIPAFFRQNPPPLRFPARGMKGVKKRALLHPEEGMTAVTHHNRVLHWDLTGLGARELLFGMEPAENYRLAYGSGGHIYILATRNGGYWSKLYHFVPVHNADKPQEPQHFLAGSIDFTQVMGILDAAFFDGDRLAVHRWGVGKKTGAFYFNCLTGEEEPCPLTREEIVAASDAYWMQDLDEQKLSTYYKTNFRSIITARYIGLNLNNRCLMIDGYTLRMRSTQDLLWARTGAGPSEQGVRLVPDVHPLNPKVRLLTRTWRDGSQATLDSRGLLHLRSSNPILPEATILAVTDFPLSWWTSDGRRGSTHPYFFIRSETGSWGAAEFYQQYLRAFIEWLEPNPPRVMS